MNLANLNAESLTKQLGVEIPEVYVVIAKHSVAGLEPESIAEIIGCDAKDIHDVESDENYTAVRQAIGAAVASSQADQGLIWDSIESVAASRLLERLEHERDPDFLLKAASVANRMTRRNQQNGVLDPSRHVGRAAVTLTSRMVERISNAGHREVVSEKTLSIHDGSMSNPTFDEVDSLLDINTGLTPKVAVQPDASLIEQLDRSHKENYG